LFIGLLILEKRRFKRKKKRMDTQVKRKKKKLQVLKDLIKQLACFKI